MNGGIIRVSWTILHHQSRRRRIQGVVPGHELFRLEHADLLRRLREPALYTSVRDKNIAQRVTDFRNTGLLLPLLLI